MIDAKIPPQAIDLEMAVLGAILLEADAFDKSNEILKSDYFYKESHKIIYDCFEKLRLKNINIDLLTLVSELKSIDKLDICGGISYIAALTNSINGSANIMHHSRIMQQMYFQRQLIDFCSITINDCYNNQDFFEVTDNLYGKLDKLLNLSDNKETKLIGNVLEIVLKDRKENKTNGLMTGIVEFDKLNNGAKKGDLIILAARPGMGKTAFALQIASNVSKNKENCLFFSLEMSDEQLTKRVESQESEFYIKKIESGVINSYEVEKLSNAHKSIIKMGLHIDDTAGNSIQKMKLKAKRIKQRYGLDLIIVDYLQLISGNTKGNRENEISEISRNLKVMAKELEVPVIALSQLSRAVESRGDKRPMLSDLRESGAIEQDADMVIFLYREKYYNKEIEKDVVEAIVAKNRAGALTTLFFEFMAEITKYKEINGIEVKKEKITPFNDIEQEYDNGFDFKNLTPF